MSGHGITKCGMCGVVIAGCRCMNKHETTYTTCAACLARSYSTFTGIERSAGPVRLAEVSAPVEARSIEDWAAYGDLAMDNKRLRDRVAAQAGSIADCTRAMREVSNFLKNFADAWPVANDISPDVATSLAQKLDDARAGKPRAAEAQTSAEPAHEIVRCSVCDKVIITCKCIGPHTVKYEVCSACAVEWI